MTPETQLKKAIREYLAYHGYFCFPITQGLGSYKGICDLIALKNGKVIFIECKSLKGKLSKWQEGFQIDISLRGGNYAVVRSIEDLKI